MMQAGMDYRNMQISMIEHTRVEQRKKCSCNYIRCNIGMYLIIKLLGSKQK